MKISIPVQLPFINYIRPIKLADDGAVALTHQASIRDETGAPARAYIKHYPQGAVRGLLNEFIGHAVLSVFGVPQPRTALIEAPIGGHGPRAWAFASFVPTPTFEGTPKQIYDLANDAACKRLIQRIMDCQAMPVMVAADQLLINGDRNLGNFVFTGKTAFVGIDSGEILGGNAWTLDSLQKPTTWVDSKVLQVCRHYEPIPNRFASAVFVSAELVCEQLWEHFAQLRKELLANSAPSVHREVEVALDAIWWRSLDLVEWFRDELKLL